MREPDFATDLYDGTAAAYDRFRLPYSPALVADLLERVGADGRGRLLDLACGTGQLAFALRGAFAETWAVDQEPGMVEVVAARAGGTVRAIVERAEDLLVEPGRFDLIVIGNAFHRLARPAVAARAARWLRPAGFLALCWSDSPWAGGAPWQVAFGRVLDRWRRRLGVADRLPPDWARARQSTPDGSVLAAAGFEPAGRFEFVERHRWTIAQLAGFVYSTSFLPGPVFGDRASAFEADLAAELAPHLRDGALEQAVGYAYDLVRKPPG